MAVAGYRAAVKLTGTSSAMVGEPMTQITTTTAIVTNTAKRVFDPAQAVTILDNAVDVSASCSVDYVSGVVTRTSGTWTGPVTVDANYLPLLTVAEVNGVKINMSRPELETSIFGVEDKAFILGEKSASGEIASLDLGNTDLDPGAGTETIEAMQDAATPKLLEVTLDPDAALGHQLWRGWVLFPGLDLSSAPSELVKSNVKWTASKELALAGFGFA